MDVILVLLLINTVFIQPLWSIQCYTCSESGFFCPLPLNLDGGDESNENEIEVFNYDNDHYCESDHYLDPRTGVEKLILRGTPTCEELNIPNHRRHCCRTNNCNKHLPHMIIQTLADTNPIDARFDVSHSNQVHPMFFSLCPSIVLVLWLHFL